MNNNLIQLFTSYNLTRNQAIVLTILAQNNTCLSAKQIAQQSKIARESIYLTLKDLKEKGLVEKRITNPKKYKAIPLKTLLTTLFNQKNKEIHEIENLTTQVLLEYDKTSKIKQIEEKSQFILIPKDKQLVNKLSKAIFNSKKTIKIMTSWNRYLKGAVVYNNAFKNALSNGVNLQVLVAEKSKKALPSKEANFFHDHPNTTIKYINSQVNVVEALIDDQEVFLMTDPKADLTESSALWSNNKSLIAVINSCFDAVFQIS